MIMTQDGTSHNRKVCIGTDKVMRKQFDEIKQLDKCGTLNLHRNMLIIEQNTMFIIINIRRILEAPRTVIDRQRNRPVILSCRMIDSSCVPHIFLAEQTLWITALFRLFCCGYRLRIFLRLGEINRNINITINAWGFPPYILLNPITADIISILT